MGLRLFLFRFQRSNAYVDRIAGFEGEVKENLRGQPASVRAARSLTRLKCAGFRDDSVVRESA